MRRLGLLLVLTTTVLGATQANGAAPTGRLTGVEYRVNARAERSVHRLDLSKSSWRPRLKAICVMFRGRGSALLDSEHQSCLAIVAFVGDYKAFTSAGRACSRKPDPYACLADLFRQLGAKATADADAESATNAVLTERKIAGTCRKAVGSTQRDIDTMRHVAATAELAATAATDVDVDKMQSYAKEIDRAVGKGFGSGDDVPVSSCRHG